MVVALVAVLVPGICQAGRIWWDGSVDEEDGPPGKLLSDNDGYWGESILTGVEYTYDPEPTNPADIYKQDKERFGRRLLDGRPAGNWWVPVGVNYKPLVVTFDFKRPCVFSEVDICTRSKQVAVKVECAEEREGIWTLAADRKKDDCPEQAFHRLPMPDGARGRYLRLTVDSGGITWLDEVLVWGDAEVSQDTPEYIQPTVPTPVATEIAFSSVPGIEKTAFSDAQYWDWQREIGQAAEASAVWSLVPTWDSISDKPILPGAGKVASWVSVTMARNETESAALALTNTSCTEPRTVTVKLDEFRSDDGGQVSTQELAGVLRIGGAIPSRHYGTNIGPLLQEGNMPGASLLRKYLTNGASIAQFPQIVLPPAGSAILWASVSTDQAKPGVYTAELSCSGAASVTVRVRVVDVTLPKPFVWLNTWSGTTSMFPFVYSDRREREVTYKQGLGITVWNGFPEPGTDAALAHERGRTIHHVYGIPADYVHKGYASRLKPEDLTAEDDKTIGQHVRDMVKAAGELGLSYDEWYGELWDEPGKSNSLLYGALAGIIRKADPKVRIYCNPCFWSGNGVLGDDEVHEVLSPWYRENTDISVPLFLLLRDRPKCLELFDSERFVRAFYTVSTQSAKSERAAQVRLYRRQAWDAFSRGWNGWGFYSYYAPRGNPWTDLDGSWSEDRPDYEMVYPGPRGPIPTRQSEAVREGWEDYCLLSLMRQRGMDRELSGILKAYQDGEAPAALKKRALSALAR